MEHCEEFNRDKRVYDSLLPGIRAFTSETGEFETTARLSFVIRLPADVSMAEMRERLERLWGPKSIRWAGGEEPVRGGKRNPLVRAFLRSIRAGGGTPRFKLKTGTSDMNVVAQAWDCPMIAYGPGDSRWDHTPDERIEIEEFFRGVDVLERALLKL